jgi:hypothetical protein
MGGLLHKGMGTIAALIGCAHALYLYMTIFIGNAANLSQLIFKTSRISNRNENVKNVETTCHINIGEHVMVNPLTS